jgi:hypothetical protein
VESGIEPEIKVLQTFALTTWLFHLDPINIR